MSYNKKSCRVLTACVHCRDRKERCNGGKPCNRCIFHNKECVYIPKISKRRAGRNPRYNESMFLMNISAKLPVNKKLLNFEEIQDYNADEEKFLQYFTRNIEEIQAFEAFDNELLKEAIIEII